MPIAVQSDATIADRIRVLVDSAPPIPPATLARVTALFRAGTK